MTWLFSDVIGSGGGSLLFFMAADGLLDLHLSGSSCALVERGRP